jgi:hypothetical protein
MAGVGRIVLCSSLALILIFSSSITFLSIKPVEASYDSPLTLNPGQSMNLVFDETPIGHPGITLHFWIDAYGSAGSWVTPQHLDFGTQVVGQLKELPYTITVPQDQQPGIYELDWIKGCTASNGPCTPHDVHIQITVIAINPNVPTSHLCPEGQTWDSNSNQCVSVCPEGQTWIPSLNRCYSQNEAPSTSGNGQTYLREFSGDVKIRMPDGSWVPATAGTILRPGQPIKTGDDGHAIIQITEGSLFQLGHTSTFRTDPSNPSNAILDRGWLWLLHKDNSGICILKGCLKIHTEIVQMTVRGTDLITFYNPYQNFQAFALKEGSIDVTLLATNQTYHMDGPLLADFNSTNLLGHGILRQTFWNNVTEYFPVDLEASHSAGISIPTWIKNNAKWWSEGSLGDDDFIKGIQYLIQQGVIVVPTTQVSTQSSQGIPSWVKNTAKWWSEGSLGDDDFIKGIQYLVQNGIIVTQQNANNGLTDMFSEATFYSGQEPSPEIVRYTDQDGKPTSMLAYPNQAVLLVTEDTPLDKVSVLISDNGGTIISQIPRLGVYLVQVNDVQNFISSASQSSFVDYVGPNAIIVPYQQQAQGSNLQYYNMQFPEDRKNVKSPDPTAKVLLVQIDDYVVGTSFCGPHGVCVSHESAPEGTGISVLHLQTNFYPDNIAANMRAAIEIAKANNQKLVINLSFGVKTTNDEGNVIVDNPTQTVEDDTKFYLRNIMNDQYFKDGNVVIAKSAGNNKLDLSQETDNLGNDPQYKDAFKNIIKTGEVEDDNSLSEYVGGTTSNYGKGIVYATASPDCGSGTSCSTYATATNMAYLWSLHYNDLKGDQIVDITRQSASTPNGGNHPVVNLKAMYDKAKEVSNCDPNCLRLGAVTNGGNKNPQPHNVNPLPPLTTIPSNTVTTEPLAIQVYGGTCTVNQYCDILIATASGGLAPYHFQSDTFANGTPPFGMTIGIYGHLTGTPTQAGVYGVPVCAVDTAGKSSCDTATVTVNQAETPPPQPTSFRSCIKDPGGLHCSDQNDVPEQTVCNGGNWGTVTYSYLAQYARNSQGCQ